MLRCVNCDKDYDVVGAPSIRTNSSRVDYYCSLKKGGCGSKRAPREAQHKHWMEYEAELNNSYEDSIEYRRRHSVGASVEPTGNVLVVGDLHLPFSKKGYLEFCIETYKKHDCTEVVFIGDILDHHYSSFHEADPDGHSAGEELDRAYAELANWKEAFPIAKVCIGNHDAVPMRKAFSAGLSKRWVRSIADVFDLEGWEFAEEFEIDGVHYTHGIGSKAFKKATDDMCSYVTGHWHSEHYVQFKVGRKFKVFGVQVGCGVDAKSYAMAYGKHFKKPAIGNAVIKNNGKEPIIETMAMGE